MTQDGSQPLPEFSRRIAVASMRGREMRREIEADRAEREAVARRLGIREVCALTAAFTVRELQAGRLYAARGVVNAEVVQSCVVTLAPVSQSVAVEVDSLFAAGFGPGEGGELVIEAEEDDVEPLQDGAIDLGELATQYLALGLDPFPHAPGVSVGDADSVETDGRGGPFAALQQLWRDRGTE
ncbi:MAG: DUF177 domain-containing protein [Acetobacterales bacterium]